MYLVSFDPGLTTGWATFDKTGDITGYGQVKLDNFPEFLGGMKEGVEVVVYEDFRLRKSKAIQQSGSTMPASQAIGQIKMFASQRGTRIISQSPTIKPIAEKWTGVKPKGPHSDSHWVDAFNHGAYWLIRQGIRKTKLEQQNAK